MLIISILIALCSAVAPETQIDELSEGLGLFGSDLYQVGFRLNKVIAWKIFILYSFEVFAAMRAIGAWQPDYFAVFYSDGAITLITRNQWKYV